MIYNILNLVARVVIMWQLLVILASKFLAVIIKYVIYSMFWQFVISFFYQFNLSDMQYWKTVITAALIYLITKLISSYFSNNTTINS